MVLVPALTGLGAPHWNPDARGIITGITRGTKRGHLARAALEGIAMQIYDLLDAMRSDSGEDLSILRVDGGAAANDLLMQFQADVLGVEIHRPAVLETTAMGAAYLAALGVGVFSGLDDVAKNWTHEETYKPSMDERSMVSMVAKCTATSTSTARASEPSYWPRPWIVS